MKSEGGDMKMKKIILSQVVWVKKEMLHALHLFIYNFLDSIGIVHGMSSRTGVDMNKTHCRKVSEK